MWVGSQCSWRLSSPPCVSPETPGGVRPQQGEGGGVPALRQAVHRCHQGAQLAMRDAAGWPCQGHWGQCGAGGAVQGRGFYGHGGSPERCPPADLASPRQDYELQLVTFKAQVEPMASPAKKPKVQSASDSIIQEVRGDTSGWSRHVAEPGAPSVGAEGCSTGRAWGLATALRGGGAGVTVVCSPPADPTVCCSTWTCGHGTAS